ncbi:MAG: hypothetical protein M5R36_12850 [Deltaproteobacteria bacterium]|nr:hypothetical protein [Deltaproteobacteria bacterium]
MTKYLFLFTLTLLFASSFVISCASEGDDDDDDDAADDDTSAGGDDDDDEEHHDECCEEGAEVDCGEHGSAHEDHCDCEDGYVFTCTTCTPVDDIEPCGPFGTEDDTGACVCDECAELETIGGQDYCIPHEHDE